MQVLVSEVVSWCFGRFWWSLCRIFLWFEGICETARITLATPKIDDLLKKTFCHVTIEIDGVDIDKVYKVLFIYRSVILPIFHDFLHKVLIVIFCAGKCELGSNDWIYPPIVFKFNQMSLLLTNMRTFFCYTTVYKASLKVAKPLWYTREVFLFKSSKVTFLLLLT